tara:strand:- start:33 stop:512 length:480 start_codon:yes stop_codon:yes gene_type:complete
MQEVFKDIPNYKGMYQVSNLGNVKSLNYNKSKKEKLLILDLYGGQYYRVLLQNKKNRKKFSVHQLVAITFLDYKKTNGMVLDHIDNNPLNNCVNNIQVVSNRFNVSKDIKNKTSKYTGVSKHKDGKWVSSIHINGVKKYLGLFTDEYKAHLAYKKELKL